MHFTTARTKSSQSTVFPPTDVTLLPGSCPRRLAATSHQSPALLTAVSRFPSNGSWSSFYSIGKDCTENTASNSYSSVVTQPLPSNGSFSGSAFLALSKYATILLWKYVQNAPKLPAHRKFRLSGKIRKIVEGKFVGYRCACNLMWWISLTSNESLGLYLLCVPVTKVTGVLPRWHDGKR
jgi:hypothetical protein